MNKESKLLIAALFIAIISAALMAYYQNVVLKNFVIFTSDEDIPTYPSLLEFIENKS